MISGLTLAFVFFITLTLYLNNFGAKYWYFDFLLTELTLKMKHCFAKRPNEILACPRGKEDLQWFKPKTAILYCTKIFSLSKISAFIFK